MKRPWIPLFVDDYRSDTIRLTTLQHGAYFLLILDYWKKGGLPTDENEIATICGLSPKEWAANRSVLARFFTLPAWSHKRLDAEIARVESVSKKRADAVNCRADRGGNVIKFKDGDKK